MLKILILQHPQEKRDPRSSIPIILENVPGVKLKIGFSSPNLTRALGSDVQVDPKKWAVLYLGSEGKATNENGEKGGNRIRWKKGSPPESLEGVVLLDGTWSQAKTLWWRNAWLLKLRRAWIDPSGPSIYGKIRKEPNPKSVSTLEALAAFIADWENAPEFEQNLVKKFEDHLKSNF